MNKHFSEVKNKMEKMCGGIDIHKENLAGCIIDENGNISREHSFPFSKEAIRISRLPKSVETF